MHRVRSVGSGPAVELGERIARCDPAHYETRSGVHDGAGEMEYSTLLDGQHFNANLFFVHRGVLRPGGGIGHHFHNSCEEMYLVFDNEAEFTVDGRTSLLQGPVGVPCRMGHSHAIYNRSTRPTEFMNINVTKVKGRYDNFDLGDDRVAADCEAPPVFMSVDLSDREHDGGGVHATRLISPGVFSGPWSYLDHVSVCDGAQYVYPAQLDEEGFAYVLSGTGRVEARGEHAGIKEGDAVPLVGDDDHVFKCEGSTQLRLMVVGIALQ